MKKLLLSVLALIAISTVHAQSVDEILNRSEVIRKNEKLFLKYNTDKSLKVSIHEGNLGQLPDPLPFDQAHPYFLPRKNAVNTFIVPLNPLSYHFKTTTTYRIDSIQLKFDDALAALISSIKPTAPAGNNSMGFRDPSVPVVTPDATCAANIANIKKAFDDMDAKLKSSQREEINKAFTKLKEMTFEDRNETKEILAEVKTDITPIKTHFTELSKQVTTLAKLVSEFSCNSEETKFLFSMATYAKLKDILSDQKLQIKRLELLENAYAMADATYKKAAKKVNNIELWALELPTQKLQENKITDMSLEIERSGLKLVDNEIVPETSESLQKYTLSFRKFNHFVPEVAAGVIFSDLSFPNYGTGTDATGNTVVTDAGEAKVSKFSVASMINLNYFVQNSWAHPFIQLGLGVNTDYQTLIMGVGIRLTSGIKRLGISVGGASPWYNKLGTLQLGSKVGGTADIEKDYVKEISWFKKYYIGIQYKL